MSSNKDSTEDISVRSFRSYLKIDTSHPNPNYDCAVNFLQGLAKDIGLICNVVQVSPTKPVVVMTWLGENTALLSILLNSHMDVVPVYHEKWKHDPFGGEKDEEGNIYGRGTQDMKSVGIQYIESIRRLKKIRPSNLRTVHVTFVPDEEIGGTLGMNLFVQTKEFKQLNVGFALDEGVALPEPYCLVFNSERAKWWLKVKCSGAGGHRSRLIDNTAAEKFQKVINKFLEYREEQFNKLKTNSLDLGDVVTVNLTMVSGGLQVNVIPSELCLDFDIRVPPTYDQKSTKIMFERMAKDVSPDVTVEWLQYYESQSVTSTAKDDVGWKAFSTALDNAGIQHMAKVFPGGSDARYLRAVGIPAIGFSAMPNTPTLLHEHDEFLNEAVFLRGIEVYEKLIQSLANVE